MGVERNEDFYERLAKVGPELKHRMLVEGTLMVGYSKVVGLKPNFLRMVCLNPNNTEADMIYILDEVQRLGDNI